MRIPLTPAKADKLTALLAKANGCGRAHTYTHASDLMALAEEAEASLDRAGIPKSKRKGATLAAASGPKTFTSAYQRLTRLYIATRVELTRTGSGWTVIAIKRVDHWTSEGAFARLDLTASQREIVSSKALARTCKLW
tara:strand:- start:952 stop:1365 length:414 start_codon:yes stop_codon:yes gene_type:complete